ncbi:hypothetical protein [Halobacillus faecis]|uniref:Lipoprotein n=1 Tax=Halobacillus faecis TaxID=360184 RepID=A0A511WQ81_9BACI|nr:hypothetical protein [Halobacillus faecis]GEN52423.1 hypothetical protein HFA01_06850 [Halobacillus faecis]
MKTKNVLTTAALVSTLFITACATNEESNIETETVEASEIEKVDPKPDEKIYDKDGEVMAEVSADELYFADGEVIAGMETKKPAGSGDYKSKKDPRLMIPAGYEKFTETFETFELPEERRLSAEEAEELLGVKEMEHFPIIAYDNGMIFYDGYLNRMKSQVWLNDERPYPFGTQSLGLFITIVETSVSDIQIPWEGRGFKEKPLEEFSKMEREYFVNSHGFNLMQQKNMYLNHQFRQFETYFSENGNDDLAAWTTKTVDLMEHADTLSRSDWEEAYTYYYEAVQRIFAMDQSIPKQDISEE